MKTRQMISAALLAAAATLSLTGCSGTGKSGTDYTMTVDRNLQFRVPTGVRNAHQAAVSAFGDLGFTVDTQSVDAMKGIVKGKNAVGDAVVAETFKEGDNLTRVDVFVGPLGDEPLMKELMNAIEKRAR